MDNLPTETLLEVIKYLDYDSIQSLRQTSKRLRALIHKYGLAHEDNIAGIHKFKDATIGSKLEIVIGNQTITITKTDEETTNMVKLDNALTWTLRNPLEYYLDLLHKLGFDCHCYSEMPIDIRKLRKIFGDSFPKQTFFKNKPWVSCEYHIIRQRFRHDIEESDFDNTPGESSVSEWVDRFVKKNLYQQSFLISDEIYGFSQDRHGITLYPQSHDSRFNLIDLDLLLEIASTWCHNTGVHKVHIYCGNETQLRLRNFK